MTRILLAIGLAAAGGAGLYALARHTAAKAQPNWGGGTPQFDPFGTGTGNYSPAPNPYQGSGPTGYYAGGGPEASYY